LGLVQAEAVLAELEGLFYGPSEPGGTDQPGHAHVLALGHETVVEGQLTGAQMAADQQVMPRRGGDRQRPRIPALPFGAASGKRTSQRRAPVSKRVTAWAQDSVTPSARVRRKADGTRST